MRTIRVGDPWIFIVCVGCEAVQNYSCRLFKVVEMTWTKQMGVNLEMMRLEEECLSSVGTEHRPMHSLSCSRCSANGIKRLSHGKLMEMRR